MKLSSNNSTNLLFSFMLSRFHCIKTKEKYFKPHLPFKWDLLILDFILKVSSKTVEMWNSWFSFSSVKLQVIAKQTLSFPQMEGNSFNYVVSELVNRFEKSNFRCQNEKALRGKKQSFSCNLYVMMHYYSL